MLVLIQLINHMRFLEYTSVEITSVFQDIKAGELTFENLTDILGLDELTPNQEDRAIASLPKVESAIRVSEAFKVS